MPSTGQLARRRDFSLENLRKSVPEGLHLRPVYVYVIKTVGNRSGRFHQIGSAPNFQGGRITLCTCKHKDRAYAPPKDCRGPDANEPWNGIWVAGICSPEAFSPRALFYLMLVKEVFDSHADAWTGLKRPLAKSASRSRFGDIYEPLPFLRHKWLISQYEPCADGHVHDDPHSRYKDIEQVYRPDRHPRLLVGDVAQSYLWSSPLIRMNNATDAGWKTAHHRFYPRLSDFLRLLR